MMTGFGWSVRAVVCVGLAFGFGAASGQRSTTNFDHGWLFQQSDGEGADKAEFADGGWSQVELPHDWAIAGPFVASNPSGAQGAFAPAGVGWYRKHFALADAAEAKRVSVEFDGVMANSDVWINGFHLGHRPNGYVSFRYDLTGHLKFGKAGENVLSVRADNAKQPSSRFYEGAGIYRHVRLVVTAPVHLMQWSTFASASDVTAAKASVHVETAVFNESGAGVQAGLHATLMDPAGKVAAEVNLPAAAIGAKQQETLRFTIPLPKPDRWDTNHPVLYTARVEVVADGKAVDAEQVAFGIRDVHFEPNTGFWINGRNVKLLGVALHSDVGSLGMAAPLGAWEHRLAAMRAMGANAIRTAHNPVAPEFLDLCDRMGFLVMEEMFDQWTVAKNPYDYHLYFKEWYLEDTRDVVRRDRNHPSVVMWSAGNEIHDTPNEALAKGILGPMVAEFHKNDPTRPVTQALFRPNVSHDYDNGLADLLDVVGQNYRPNEIIAAHAQKPSRSVVGTENTHGRDQWLPVRDHAEYSGEFLWAGTDYLGEARRWPVFGDQGGMNDRTDAPKADSLERESWWKTEPVVHVIRRTAPVVLAPTDPGYEAPTQLSSGSPRPQTEFRDWTPANQARHEERVEVFSNCDEVELFLNGKSLGKKGLNADASPRVWMVEYVPGELKAVAKNHRVVVANEVMRTAGKAAKVLLTVERARLSSAWDDVGYVRATVVDEQGTRVPDAALPLEFSVTGPGRLLATDNADNSNYVAFASPVRNAYRGTAIAIVRGTANKGDVVVKVSAAGLAGASTTLHISQ
jgi:beta-galactosidase